jgi:hypothetical protein
MMTTGRLYLREEGTEATGDSVLLSSRPQAGAVLKADAASGLRPVSLDVVFTSITSIAANADTTLSTGVLITGGNGVGVVPPGWKANLYLMHMQTYEDGTDITLATAKLSVAGFDVSADWGVLSAVPTADDSNYAFSEPLVAPYVIDATEGRKLFTVIVTANGTAGVMGAQVRVLGYMYKAV